LDATLEIIETFNRSRVPIIVYVYPRGAKAWSAGTFILLSGHVAAMSPYTVTGSSQPVSYSPLGSVPINDPKIINALSALIAEEARMHSRNETVARLFITENLNLNSEDALRLKVIEAVASSPDELLAFIDGMKVETAHGIVTLRTVNLPVISHSPGIRIQFLSVVSDPLIAFLLFTIGLYGLIFGLASPGYATEILGAIALLLGMIGLGFDINLVGGLLVALGAVLMIIEAHTPGFGVFGGAGLICIVAGSLLLFPFGTERWLISSEWYSLFVTLVGAVATILGFFTFFMVYKIVQARRRKPILSGIVGETVEVVEEISPNKVGFVKFRGEYWRARSKITLREGSLALVVGKEGPILLVEPKPAR
jgi:membrane-bound serine protease (ClpP class)